MVTCPDCKGEGKLYGLLCSGGHGGPAHIGSIPCPRCKGKSTITKEDLERIAAGKLIREDRIRRRVTMRAEANRLGIDVLEYSKLESGRS